MYPMTVEKYSAVHRGGTKEYGLIRITNQSGKSLVVTRWARKGEMGEIDVKSFETADASLIATNRKYAEKFERGGYEVGLKHKETTVHNLAELRGALGLSVHPRLGANNYLFIDPEADVEGVRSPENPEFEKLPDGSYRKKQKPPRVIEETEEDKIAAQIAQNEMWGMF